MGHKMSRCCVLHNNSTAQTHDKQVGETDDQVRDSTR